MNAKITLTYEELIEMEQLLEREMDSTHTEMHRTKNKDFKDHIRHHLETIEHMLKVTREARLPETVHSA